LALRAKEIGMSGIVYTNIAQDGTLAGPDIERTDRMARETGLPVVLSGGIGSEDDVRQIAEKADSLIAGAILGKSLYENQIDLARVIELFQKDTKKAEW